ncbi:hypothetical protein CspeluHIS016_0903060 [Cutaneotrichosporon spelunceum]|uniref:Uncharacterized protein n=1 Tax=Cutaneotrichosporon spelunceum TaxID=1672016 RepID=A0AAD3U053_9TREE|nr:hypothetical protein CspeluHIS016_0903060 [Cutaneotrichosporon spelunceum]
MRMELAEPDAVALTKLDVMSRDWIAEFGRSIDVQMLDPPGYDSTDRATLPGESKNALQLYLACLGDLGREVQTLWGEPEIQSALVELWLTSYLALAYGAQVPGLELRGRMLERWKLTARMVSMLSALEVLPAYDRIMNGGTGTNRAMTAVQAGSFVLLPSLLAEENAGTLESSPLLMLPGLLQVGGVTEGFFPEECARVVLIDLRETEPPADASASSPIEYHYAEAERGCALQVIAAGHELDLAGALKGILGIRRLRGFEVEAEHATWLKAAPHHAVADPKPHVLVPEGRERDWSPPRFF